MPLAPNPGYLPDDCLVRNEAGEVVDHRRVRVVLFGGYDTARNEPVGWPSGGRGGCNWRIGKRPHSHDIKEYEVL